VTGESGTVGFGNITIPISAVTYGTTPTIYIDGQIAPNQGYTQDSNNYYVWYTTHFSTHLITIEFTATPNSAPSPSVNPSGSNRTQVHSSSHLEIIYGVVAGVVIVAIVIVALMLIIRGKNNKSSNSVSTV
jgi:beta-lactamase regulating signal transducer with metallopeptidase domain